MVWISIWIPLFSVGSGLFFFLWKTNVSSFLAYILGNSDVIRQVSRNAVLLSLLPDKCYQCLFPSIDFFIAPNMSGQRNVGQGGHAR